MLTYSDFKLIKMKEYKILFKNTLTLYHVITLKIIKIKHFKLIFIRNNFITKYIKIYKC